MRVNRKKGSDQELDSMEKNEETLSRNGQGKLREWIWRPWGIVVLSMLYAWIMLVTGGATSSRMHGCSPYHRFQADALLHGRMEIGVGITNIEQNLVWHEGKIQQVWGLGVGLWCAPFQALARLVGGDVFPDRIALGVAFFLFATYSGFTSARLRITRGYLTASGLWGLLLACPGLQELNAGRHQVYEDTCLYACLVSLAGLVCLIRVLAWNSKWDLLACAVLAEFSGFVRPTHLAYGFMATCVGTVAVFQRGLRIRWTVFSIVVFLSGLALLAWTNAIRFGSPTEFGHKQTITGGPMILLTRFANPFEKAGMTEATKELLGAMFLPAKSSTKTSAEENMTGMTSWQTSFDKVVQGQSVLPRWRDMYMRTFDWSYAVLVLVVVVGGCMEVIRGTARKSKDGADAWISGGLWIWGSATLIILGLFYLRFPFLTARYLLDFCPSFCAMTILAWLWASARFTVITSCCLVSWQVWQGWCIRTDSEPGYLLARREIPIRLNHVSGKSLGTFDGCYTVEKHPLTTGIEFNGNGWTEDGLASSIVVLAIDKPRFIEIQVEKRLGSNETEENKDIFHARIGLDELNLQSVQSKEGLLCIRFGLPDRILRRNDDEMLFLCFSNGKNEAEQLSRRMLHSVRWR